MAKAIFTILADHEVNVMMISQGSSEANISLIVDESHLSPAVKALSELMKQGAYVKSPTTTTSAQLRWSGQAWQAPRVPWVDFTALGHAEVNVMMISQGSSEANISFVVSQNDGPKAVRALHDEFHLSEESDD